jgi:tRNA U34 5-methylaminomethyl-2-thiouridine-forming methyltransferase MnmC
MGFPTLTVQEQCNLLYPLDRTTKKIIETKTGIEDQYPDIVLDYYITIDKDELVEHLRAKDFKSDWKYQYDKGQDNCWLKEITNGTALPSYELILQERGNREVIHFDTYDQFLDYFAIQRLQLVPKYRLIYKDQLEKK